MFARILAIAYITYTILVLGTSSVNIDVTGVDTIYLNKDYINVDTYINELQPGNETYTKIHKHIDLIQNIPDDLTLTVDLIRYQSEDDSGEYFDTYSINVCDQNDIYHPYLADFILEMQTDGHCAEAGTYDFEDGGQFKFNKLLDDSDLEGYSFRIILTFRSSVALLKIGTVDSKSV